MTFNKLMAVLTPVGAMFFAGSRTPSRKMKAMQGLLGATLLLSMMVVVGTANAHGLRFEAKLSRAQTVPLLDAGMIGDASVKVRFNEGFSEAKLKMTLPNGGNALAAHFHCGEPGVIGPPVVDILIGFDGETASGTLTNDDIGIGFGDCDGLVTNLVSLAFAMRDGLIYANVHTTDAEPGEVRGQLLGHGDDDDDDDDSDDDSDD